MSEALKTQIGGGHYKDMAIQPMELSMANGLDACQHTAIKYIMRFRAKNGLEDLDKAIHCIEMLKEFYKAELLAQDAAAECKAWEKAQEAERLADQALDESLEKLKWSEEELRKVREAMTNSSPFRMNKIQSGLFRYTEDK